MDAIAEIYAALDDEEVFAHIPEIVARAAGARSAILQVFDATWRVQDVHLNYFTKDMLARYLDQGLWQLDPWKLPAVHALNRFMSMDEAVPPERLVDSAFFNENFRYWGDDTARCLAGAYDVPGGFLAIGVHRGLSAKDFSEAEFAQVSAVAPHVRRLFEIRRRLRTAETRAILSGGALDAQPNAVFIVDGLGRPQMMNRQAEMLVARGDGLGLTRVGLRAVVGGEERTLAVAIQTACARKGPQGGAFRLSRPEGPPLRVVVGPLGYGSRTFALVVVGDPVQGDPNIIRTLMGMYSLTLAEAETAAALGGGQAPAEIAKSRGVSIATTRTQVRQILQKTGSRSLAEVAAAAASVPVAQQSSL